MMEFAWSKKNYGSKHDFMFMLYFFKFYQCAFVREEGYGQMCLVLREDTLPAMNRIF